MQINDKKMSFDLRKRPAKKIYLYISLEREPMTNLDVWVAKKWATLNMGNSHLALALASSENSFAAGFYFF